MFDEKIRKALFIYLKSNTFRDITYYILVWEHEPFNNYSLYRLELEDSPEKSFDDLNITYAMDYDEGQDIDVLMIFDECAIKNNCINFYLNTKGINNVKEK